MPEELLEVDPLELNSQSDLQTVLAAWHTATVRLEQTHAALRREVARLTDELEAKNRELARRNRLADLGQMAAHVAHEVRNNLAPITLYLSLLRRKTRRPESLEVLDKIAAGFTALDATVHDLLHFTADREPRSERFLLRDLLAEIASALAPQWKAQRIAGVVDVPPRARMVADRNMIRRALVNLVLNAMDAMPDGGELRLSAVCDPPHVQVSVADGGTGFSEETQGRLFEPFFSTKSGGTGLGLAIVDRIAEAHGGYVTAANRPEGGALFTLHIPQPKQEVSR